MNSKNSFTEFETFQGYGCDASSNIEWRGVSTAAATTMVLREPLLHSDASRHRLKGTLSTRRILDRNDLIIYLTFFIIPLYPVKKGRKSENF